MSATNGNSNSRIWQWIAASLLGVVMLLFGGFLNHFMNRSDLAEQATSQAVMRAQMSRMAADISEIKMDIRELQRQGQDQNP